jgi:hypothetical protein
MNCCGVADDLPSVHIILAHKRIATHLEKIAALRGALERLRLCAAECVAHQGGWDESPEESFMNAHTVYVWANEALETP